MKNIQASDEIKIKGRKVPIMIDIVFASLLAIQTLQSFCPDLVM
ncbi:MAG: hypothetical protein ACUVTL_02645 [Thermoproteota archaeon]